MTEIIDMSRFIEAKSDQLNADDLIGISKTITVTKVTGSDGDQPISIHYDGDNGKPWKPCKTMRRVMAGIWGRYANEYVGRSMTIYRDDRVTFGGLEVGGVRISHMSHIDKETVVVLLKSKGKKVGFKVLPLTAAPDKKAAAPKNTVRYDFIAAIENCQTTATLRQWWKERGDAIPDEIYADVLDAFNKRLTALKSPRPSTPAPSGDDADNQGADRGGGFQEGRAVDDMGEPPTLGQAKDALDRCETEDELTVMLDSYRGQLGEAEYIALCEYAEGIRAKRWGGDE